MSEDKADDVKNEQTQAAGQGAATDNKKADVTGGAVESSQKSHKTDDGLPKGVKVEFFNLRQEKRELAAAKESLSQENAQLKGRLDAIERKLSETTFVSSNETDDISILDNPKEFANRVKKQAIDEAKKAIFQERDDQIRYSEAVLAEKWLLTRKHIQDDPKLQEELSTIIRNNYSSVASQNPKAAARSAYIDLCEQKGIDPDLSGFTTKTDNLTGNGAKPSSAGTGGNNLPEKDKDLMSYLSKLPSDKRAAEVRKAINEGRIKSNKVIKI